jgi:hypothetical protein
VTSPRRFAFLSALSLGFLCAARSAGAQDAPHAPPPPFPGVPLGPVDAPAPVLPEPKKQWYGWQILLPTIALDLTMFGSELSGSSTGQYIALASLVGRGITGPIVHLAHGHPLKALASLGLEGALPGLVLAAFFAQVKQCRTASSDGAFCVAPLVTALVGMPIALTLGAAVDSGALAWEDNPAAQRPGQKITWTVAPIVLPPLHAGTAHVGPTPVGGGLVGMF